MHFSDLPHGRALVDPLGPALADDDGALDNAALLARTESAAAVLAAHGVRDGDVVAVLLPNRVDLIIALFAAWQLGAAVTPINPVLGDAEARYQLTDAGARVVVTDTGRDLGVPALTPAALAEGEATGLPERHPRPDSDLALLIYTSGTTGSPKGVMLTHANLDAMTASFAEWFELGPEDHSLLVLPLFHANGIVLGTLTPLRAGGRVTITGRFSRDRFFDDVERVRPTYFSAVPAIYALLSTLPDGVRPDTSSLRFGVCGAAPMPVEAIERFEDRFGITIVEGYGLSETTTASTINPLRGLRKPGTVGLPLPGQRVEVVDADGRAVPVGERGEVVISGPVVMAGYLGRPEETARTIVDGRLRTGDIGCFDEDGYLRIVDRIKDMIIRGGENVYPKEIENALYAHLDVHEAAVVGRRDDVLGEVPVAFVSLVPGSTASAPELSAHAARLLARFKQPEVIEIVAEIPKNPVGKIDKPALRRMLEERV
ncbi:AMP-binding protein [Microbacterium sp. 13-71-7]|uniref:class I adenylate-forming enzyme family protein n=1 Tax=Microbacterium sp. 13-71-7 TaxID=1970399 RepID=UPI000BDC1BCC|nr:AMP-binding protein [Microbacterium sp. 13-71-7]OZB84008.1 MAG: AMP-dependent synthetase [Microbacterium sp. 13-71-7]